MGSASDIDQDRIFSLSPDGFEDLALEIFRFQYQHNEIYQQYCNIIKCSVGQVDKLSKIPFLPISFFKNKIISTTSFSPEIIFESSGTTGSVNSKHFVKDISTYEKSCLQNFEQVYGSISDYCIIGLLPSYLEKGNSSLVWMTNELIKRSGHQKSGFYLYDHEKLHQALLETERVRQPCIVIGVTYALIDFAMSYPMQLRNTIVLETGGMKGRKKESTREEVHELLQKYLGVKVIHAEYGMTELLSQAYAKKGGIFTPAPWMKVLVRAEDDPFAVTTAGMQTSVTGAGNIIDLANIYSCSFIATDDMIRLHPGGNFEVLGRLDNSDIRGCGLMIL